MASTTKESESNSPVIAMRGAGYYSANTVGAKAVIDAAADLVLEALDSMPLAGEGAFAIADYGAADGGTSIDITGSSISRGSPFCDADNLRATPTTGNPRTRRSSVTKRPIRPEAPSTRIFRLPMFMSA